MLPDKDGFQVCREICDKAFVIMLTARNDVIDKILGIEIGADDYITKPFEIREVTARIKSIFRRVSKNNSIMSNITQEMLDKGLYINLNDRKVYKDGIEIELKKKEFDLLSFLYRNKNFYVMNNAIELNRYAYNEVKRKEMRNTLQLNGKIVFGHVGNMCAQKNHLFLLDIFKEIVNLNRNSKLILIGDGVLRKAIEERIKAYQLEEQVLILGKKSDVENYYQAMDCMILPSLYEGLPMVGVEAQCAGVPILFSDTITQEIGTNFSAYLSLKDSPMKWAQKALQLADCGIDRQKCRDIMEEKGFSILKEALKIEEKYIEMEKEK